MMFCSILIFVYDEVDYIDGCLDNVLLQDYVGLVQVIVIVNGCYDDIVVCVCVCVGDFVVCGWVFQVEELVQGGKIGVLNYGDVCVGFGICVYLDVDLCMLLCFLLCMVEVLDVFELCYVGGRLVVVLVKSWVLCIYVCFWQKLFFVVDIVIGVG